MADERETALKTGTASNEAAMAPADSIRRYRPIIRPARCGMRRLIRLAIKTFISAMAAPATTVPGNSSARGLKPRRTRPAASSSSAAHSTRSSPNRRLSGAAAPEKTPKHSTGTAASSASVEAETCSADSISGKIGGRLVIAARRLPASTRIATTNSAPPRAGVINLAGAAPDLVFTHFLPETA